MMEENSKLKLLIDARMVISHPHGISRYVEDIGKGLAEIGPKNYVPYFLVDRRFSQDQFSGFPVVRSNAPFLSQLEWFEIPRVIREHQIDFYHSPSFSSLLHCPCPWAVTLHDLNHLHFGSFFKKLYYGWVVSPFAQKARSLITVSQTSRNEISKWLSLPREKIEVVPNAISLPSEKVLSHDEAFFSEFRLRPGSYVMTLSHLKPHKNLSRLVAAHQRFCQQNKHAWPLVLPVPPKSFRGEKLIEVGSLQEESMQKLLKNAGGLAFPSLYEGFGRPPVEAAILGVPILVSDIEVHREILAGVPSEMISWVKPQDEMGWKQAISRLQFGTPAPCSPPIREQLKDRFSVSRLGIDMDRIYRRVLGLPL